MNRKREFIIMKIGNLVFAYNRSQHLQKVLEGLKK